MSKQLVRQLDMLRELQAARYGRTLHELAKEFRVTVRTVQRDLWDLRDAGFVLRKETREDQHASFHLVRETGLPLNLTDMEVAAMICAERAGLGLVGTPLGEHLESAVRRLAGALSEEKRRFFERVSDVYVPLARGYKPYEDASEKLASLNEAILGRRVCRVSYRSPDAESPRQYEIEPLRFLPHRGGLYVISRMPKLNKLITHAVERFENVEVTEAEFDPPDHLPIDERVRDAFGISYEEPMDVVVRFAADQAPYVRERVWHPSQKLEELPDGRVVLRLRAGGFFEIRSWVLSFGAAAEVLEPEELRHAVRAEMRAALGLGEEGTT